MQFFVTASTKICCQRLCSRLQTLSPANQSSAIIPLQERCLWGNR